MPNPPGGMRNSNHQQDVTRLFHCQSSPLTGHKYADIMPQARRMFRIIQKHTKRRPYVRSAYFKKDKIFFDYFWIHLNQKHAHDRARRLRFFPCAIELLRNSRQAPKTFFEAYDKDSIRHQFIGVTNDGTTFSVVVKQDRSSGKKQLLSVFPMG